MLDHDIPLVLLHNTHHHYQAESSVTKQQGPKRPVVDLDEDDGVGEEGGAPTSKKRLNEIVTID